MPPMGTPARAADAARRLRLDRCAGCRAMFLSGEDSFMQHRAGLLAQPSFDSYVARVRFYMASPGMRAARQLCAGQFGSELPGFVTSILKETAVTRGADLYAEWNKLVQSELNG